MATLRIVKNRRAFSAIIAALILMLLAVAAGVVVYGYVMGWIGGAQQSSTNTGVLAVDSLTASVSDSKIQLYIRNSGGNDLVLDSFYVEGTAVTNATAMTTTSAKVAVQGTAYLEFEISPALESNKFYEVKAVCADGTQISSSVQAK